MVGQAATPIADSVETALKVGGAGAGGRGGREECFFRNSLPAAVRITWGDCAPHLHFNTPTACPAVPALGYRQEIDGVVLTKSFRLEGAIRPWQTHNWYLYRVEPLTYSHGFSLHMPVKDMTPEHLDLLLYGEGKAVRSYQNRFGRTVRRSEGFEGVIPTLERQYRDTESEYSRENIERYMCSSLAWSAGEKAEAGIAGGHHRGRTSWMSAAWPWRRRWPGRTISKTKH